MTKLSIEIEDVADKKACVSAMRQLFAALEAQYGEDEAQYIWRFPKDFQTPQWQARKKLDRALRGMEYSDRRLIFEYYAMAVPSKEGLAKALARKNAALHEEWREWKAAHKRWADENREDLLRTREMAHLYHKTGQWPASRPLIPDRPRCPPGLFGPRGTTDWQTMLQQIKRVFRQYPEACATVGEAPVEIRERERSEAESWCCAQTEARVWGRRTKKVAVPGHKPILTMLARGTKRKR